jgi:tRNAThr (cytosine32-N3)-methyltransferase
MSVAVSISYDSVPTTLTIYEIDVYNENASCFWNEFYQKNENKFFKDRHWLGTEFPELFEWDSRQHCVETPSHARRVVCELGCGVGNTMFPLVAELKERAKKGSEGEKNIAAQDTFVFASDFAPTAIDVLKVPWCQIRSI